MNENVRFLKEAEDPNDFQAFYPRSALDIYSTPIKEEGGGTPQSNEAVKKELEKIFANLPVPHFPKDQ